MAVRGTRAKVDITQKILETFEGSFTYEKEIRIPYIEDGVEGQIKLVLTASKNMVENADAAPTKPKLKSKTESNELNFSDSKEKLPQEPSEEEKERLKFLLNKLGFSEE